MRHPLLLTTFLLLTLGTKAELNVHMFSSPLVISSQPVQGNGQYMEIDIENNGIPDIRFEAVYPSTGFGHQVDVFRINDQEVTFARLVGESVYRAVGYNCGAEIGGGATWGNGAYLAAISENTFFEGAGPKYIGFRKFSYTSSFDNDYYFYGWIKAEVSSDRKTLTVYGFAINDEAMWEDTGSPNVFAGQGDCDVSVEEHTLPADAVTVLGNFVHVKTEGPVSIELFDLAGKRLFTDSKNGVNSSFQLPATNSLVLLRVTAGIRSRTVKLKL